MKSILLLSLASLTMLAACSNKGGGDGGSGDGVVAQSYADILANPAECPNVEGTYQASQSNMGRRRRPNLTQIPFITATRDASGLITLNIGGAQIALNAVAQQFTDGNLALGCRQGLIVGRGTDSRGEKEVRIRVMGGNLTMEILGLNRPMETLRFIRAYNGGYNYGYSYSYGR